MSYKKQLVRAKTIKECQKIYEREYERVMRLSIYEHQFKRLVRRLDATYKEANTRCAAIMGGEGIYIKKKKFLKLKRFYRSKFVSFIMYGAPYIAMLGVCLIIASIFRINRVSGHSMDPTLRTGETVFSMRFTTINRFDVVIANEFDADKNVYKIVKRVVGLPGDTIRYKDDVLTVNGKEIYEPYLEDYIKQFRADKLQKEYSYNVSYKYYANESNAFTTRMSLMSEDSVTANQADFELKVPKNSYLLLGDNRIVSKDSRSVGFFPRENITGEVIWSQSNGFARQQYVEKKK